MDEMLDTKIQNRPNQPHPNSGARALPNANSVLTLGIISLATMCMYGVPGLVTGIIALALHKKDLQLYRQNPAVYEQSFRNSKAGQVCAIIGVSISGLFVLFLVIAVIAAIFDSRF